MAGRTAIALTLTLPLLLLVSPASIGACELGTYCVAQTVESPADPELIEPPPLLENGSGDERSFALLGILAAAALFLAVQVALAVWKRRRR